MNYQKEKWEKTHTKQQQQEAHKRKQNFLKTTITP